MFRNTVRFFAASLLILCLTSLWTIASRSIALAQSDHTDQADALTLPDVRLVWSPQGDMLAVIHRGNEVTPRDEVGTFIYHFSRPEKPDFYTGRREVVFAGNQQAASYQALEVTGEVVLWDPATGFIKNTLPGFLGAVADLPEGCPLPDFRPDQIDFSYDGRLVARPERDGSVSLFSALTSEWVDGLPTVACPVVDLAFSIEGSQIATLHTDQSVQMFSAFSSQRFWQVNITDNTPDVGEFDSLPFGLAFSPRGDQLAVTTRQAEGEGAVLLLDTETGEQVASISAALPADHRLHIAYTPNGDGLVISDAFGLRLFDSAAQTLRLEYPLANREQRASSIAFNPDGRRLAYYDFETTSVLFLDGSSFNPLNAQLFISALASQTSAPRTVAAPTTVASAVTPVSTDTPVPVTVAATATELPSPTSTPVPPTTVPVQPTLTPTLEPEVTEVVHTEAPTTPPTETPIPAPTEVICLNAPPSRLTVGGTAQVTYPTESNFPHTLRVRATPNGAIIGVLISGNQVRLLEGSICENDLLWWRVETLDGALTGWSAEGQAPDVYYLEPIP